MRIVKVAPPLEHQHLFKLVPRRRFKLRGLIGKARGIKSLVDGALVGVGGVQAHATHMERPGTHVNALTSSAMAAYFGLCRRCGSDAYAYGIPSEHCNTLDYYFIGHRDDTIEPLAAGEAEGAEGADKCPGRRVEPK